MIQKMKSSSSLKKYGLKTVALLLVLMIIITLCGCSKEDRAGPTGSFEKMSLGPPSSDYTILQHSMTSLDLNLGT